MDIEDRKIVHHSQSCCWLVKCRTVEQNQKKANRTIEKELPESQDCLYRARLSIWIAAAAFLELHEFFDQSQFFGNGNGVRFLATSFAHFGLWAFSV